MPWQKVTLVGVGLLGGSLGLAVKERRLAAHVHGYVRRAESIQECRKLGVVDTATSDLLQAVDGADLVVLCTPLGQMQALVQAMGPALKPGTLVTDVGSVKASVVQQIEPLVTAAGAQFIGSHPMAGSEKIGAGAARADLFVNATCVVTPNANANSAAVKARREPLDFRRGQSDDA